MKAADWPSHEGPKPSDLVAEVLHLRGLNRVLEVRMLLVAKRLAAKPPWEAIPPSQRERMLETQRAEWEAKAREAITDACRAESQLAGLYRRIGWLEADLKRINPELNPSQEAT